MGILVEAQQQATIYEQHLDEVELKPKEKYDLVEELTYLGLEQAKRIESEALKKSMLKLRQENKIVLKEDNLSDQLENLVSLMIKQNGSVKSEKLRTLL